MYTYKCSITIVKPPHTTTYVTRVIYAPRHMLPPRWPQGRGRPPYRPPMHHHIPDHYHNPPHPYPKGGYHPGIKGRGFGDIYVDQDPRLRKVYNEGYHWTRPAIDIAQINTEHSYCSREIKSMETHIKSGYVPDGEILSCIPQSIIEMMSVLSCSSLANQQAFPVITFRSEWPVDINRHLDNAFKMDFEPQTLTLNPEIELHSSTTIHSKLLTAPDDRIHQHSRLLPTGEDTIHQHSRSLQAPISNDKIQHDIKLLSTGEDTVNQHSRLLPTGDDRIHQHSKLPPAPNNNIQHDISTGEDRIHQRTARSILLPAPHKPTLKQKERVPGPASLQNGIGEVKTAKERSVSVSDSHSVMEVPLHSEQEEDDSEYQPKARTVGRPRRKRKSKLMSFVTPSVKRVKHSL